MRLALLAVAAVWLLGCVWSFHEQTAFAAAKGFSYPHLLPLVIDGFAIAMAGVSWAASLDARTALAARVATLVAVAGSAASNGAWAWFRTGHDTAAVALAVAVPVAANIAFEVLLAEVRRQVHRRRGLPAPVAIPYPRLVRIALAPVRTVKEWRELVLELTAPSAMTGPVEVLEAPEGRAPAADVQASADPPVPVAQLDPAPEPPDVADAEIPPPPAPKAPRPRTVAADGSAPRQLIGDRPLDRRAIALAAKLAQLDDPDSVTGEAVGGLLGEQLAPRTGRRLLQQARTLAAEPRASERMLELVSRSTGSS